MGRWIHFDWGCWGLGVIVGFGVGVMISLGPIHLTFPGEEP